MNVFTALTIIAVVAIIGSTISTIIKSRSRNNKISNQHNQAIEQQIDQLKARVAALESIVTDKNYDLSHEIEQLKD